MALYRTYSDYLKEKYNEKVYKIPNGGRVY